MRAVEELTNNKFLNIKNVIDPDMGVKGYQFAERMGIDSVAFVCYDPKHGFLLNSEYKPPIDSFILGAFGGSLDKEKSHKEIVIDEVREEAGFEVDIEAIHYVGKALVSTQMNQFCMLFLVMVDKDKQKERQPENEIEALASTTWIKSTDSIYNLADWKPITIISKAICQEVINV